MQEQVQSHGQDTLKKGQRGEVRHCLESKRCFCHCKSEIKKSYGNHMEIIWKSYGHHMDIIWTSYGHHMSHKTQKRGLEPAQEIGSLIAMSWPSNHKHQPWEARHVSTFFLSLQAMESELDCAQRMFSQGRSQNVIIANAQPVTNKVQYIRMKIAMLDRRTP